MKYQKIAVILCAVFALGRVAQAELDTTSITIDNTHKTVSCSTTKTTDWQDKFVLKVNGIVILSGGNGTYNAGAHRGVTWSSSPIGYIVKTGGGGGGGGGNKEHGPMATPGDSKFSISFTDHATGITSTYSLNISFIGGSINFAGSFQSGFAYTPGSFTPVTSTSTWSNSGVTGGMYLWPFGDFSSE